MIKIISDALDTQTPLSLALHTLTDEDNLEIVHLAHHHMMILSFDRSFLSLILDNFLPRSKRYDFLNLPR